MNLAAIRCSGVRLLAGALGLLVAGVASGGVYRETGDAPSLPPGQVTRSLLPLERIHGFLSDSSDVDVYRIVVTNPGSFSARVVNAAEFDAQLFLFNLAGSGVTHNDDTPPGGISGSTLVAVPPAPGSHLLAISAFNRDPSAPAGLIWLSDPVNVERAPDGPGGFGVLSSWTGIGGYGGEYWIELTGCDPWDPSGNQPGMWVEPGDAPDLPPGQVTGGAGTLTWIEGAFGGNVDADLYRIQVTNSGSFSATTSARPDYDTQLYLFNLGGIGVTMNDDDPAGSALTSRITSVPGVGEYVLAVSPYDRDPRTAAAMPIWQDQPFFTERAPDGPGAFNPLGSWADPGQGAAAPYEITLTGATFSGASNFVAPRDARGRVTLSAFPSPSLSRVRLRGSLPATEGARLAIYDGNGRKIRGLTAGSGLAHEFEIEWDGRDDRGVRVPAGIYFARLVAPDQTVGRRIILLSGTGGLP